ncbi:MAG: DCC1-like thiol-disulfide oxidoreductase family protein [Prolixibacteraceae bacterium]
MQTIPEEKILVLFDGMCILCSRTIQFILKADRKKKFIFQTLQDSSGKESFDTVVVVHQNKEYRYFDSVLKIGTELGGIYKLVAVFRIMPEKWRRSVYMWIARNRFRWFGVRNTCYLPTPEEKSRFI